VIYKRCYYKRKLFFSNYDAPGGIKVTKVDAMKKMRIFAGLVIVGMVLACASTEVPRELDLDDAILMASRDINDKLPAGTKVALINFSSPSDVFSLYVLEEMTTHLVRSRNLVVVDRREIDRIRAEMDFQLSGDVSDDSAQRIGMMLGAQSIVTGSIITMGDVHRFRTSVINVTTAAIETSFSISINDTAQIQFLLAQHTDRPAPQVAALHAPPAAPAQPAAPAAPELREFRIGDIGPAGGIIFFDSGNNAGGWRFLEAAPVEAEFRAPWSVRLGSVRNMVRETQGDIGSGRRNTQLIVEKLRQTGGEWDSAAIKIAELEINGFSDWFLPSTGELDLMYGNLMRRGLGDFSNDWYWSSTEHRRGPDLGWGVVAQNFGNGEISVAQIGIFGDERSRSHLVRPIRQVPGPTPARASVDPPFGAAGIAEADGGPRVGWGTKILGGLLAGGLLGYIAWVVMANPDSAPSMSPSARGFR